MDVLFLALALLAYLFLWRQVALDVVLGDGVDRRVPLLVGVAEEVDQVLRTPAGAVFTQVCQLVADLLRVAGSDGLAADLVVDALAGPFNLAGRAGAAGLAAFLA